MYHYWSIMQMHKHREEEKHIKTMKWLKKVLLGLGDKERYHKRAKKYRKKEIMHEKMEMGERLKEKERMWV